LEENEEDQSNIFKTPGVMQFNNAADTLFSCPKILSPTVFPTQEEKAAACKTRSKPASHGPGPSS
jgi:hypothetical protein